MTLTEDRQDPCSVCGAKAGEPCLGDNGEELEVAVHAGRLSGGGPLRVRRVPDEEVEGIE